MSSSPLCCIYPSFSHACAWHISFLFSTMLPRKVPTKLNPGYASPHPTSGSLGGRRPLTLVTHPKTFSATTTQITEEKSPQSETSPKDTTIAPLMPPRPPLLPPLPPRNNGLGRQSTLRDTHEAFGSDLNFLSQPQPPDTMPMPAPLPPRVPVPPPTPKRFQLPVPVEHVGGFTMPSSPQHGSSHGYSHQYTADYTYRFDAMPSPRSDSSPPHYEPADISGGIHAGVWPTYNKISQEFDEKKLSKWNTDLDVLLIFVSLVLGGGR